MGLLSKKQVEVEKPKLVLYILSERNIQGLAQFAENEGVLIEEQFTSIEDVKIRIVLEQNPIRLVVIESGLGRFSSSANRDEIVDLVGVCSTENKSATMFITDSAIKTSCIQSLGRKIPNVTWEKFETTASVIDYIKKLGEEYIRTNSERILIVENQRGLKYKGVEVSTENSGFIETSNSPNYTILENIKSIDNEESIVKFKVKI